MSTFIHSKTTRKILASTRPNLKAQGPTRQKTTINPRFTSPKTAITTLSARKSYALTLPKHSFYIVIAALLHAKSIAFRGRKQHCKVTKIHKSLIDRQIQNTSKFVYLPTKNIPARISQPANAFCKDNSEGLNTRQSQVPSANLRYLFVKNKFGCSKPQFFPWSFINSFLNMSYILY